MPIPFGWLPNLLTGIRLVLAPVVLAAGIAGEGALYFGVLLAALATEIDGTVARRLGVASDFGRRFDSWTDLSLQLAAIAGFAALHPEPFRANLGYAAIGLVALTVPGIFGLVTRGEPLGYHTFLARGAGVLAGIAILVLVFTGSFTLLRISAVLEVFVATEYLTIATLRPTLRGQVDGLWKALSPPRPHRMRTENPA